MILGTFLRSGSRNPDKSKMELFVTLVNSDCSGTRTHNHLVRKRTLNHLAKLASLAK